MAQSAVFAEVVVEITNRKLDRAFHYNIPPNLLGKIKPGIRVSVPFGARTLEGFVVGITSRAEVEQTKPIAKILDSEPLVSEELLELAKWMAVYYMCPLVTVLQAFIPRKGALGPLKEKWCTLVPPITTDTALKIKKRAPKQGMILEVLQDKIEMSVKELLKLTETDSKTLKSLVSKGLVEVFLQKKTLASKVIPQYNSDPPPALTAEQRQVLEPLLDVLQKHRHQVFLLHGVTGSGKTEIYLQAVRKAMDLGYQSIVLFPEISLTTHLIDRFHRRFGDAVEVLHSRLSPRQRFEALQRIRSGEVSVIVGVRSAIFAPVKRLGLVVVDEEHETSYQQEVNPKYHAREVAIQRGLLNNVPVILGSATPSLESYFQAQQGHYRLQVLKKRVQEKPMPRVFPVDLRQELRLGNTSIFSRLLQHKILERLERQEQTILFLNRRGFANFLVCRDCGYTIKCKNCDVSLTYYADKKVLKCHYCGYETILPSCCPGCQSSRIRPFGIGTEKVEREVERLFPQARVVRIDTDTTNRKGEYERMLGMFQSGSADLMVGTQMVAKGLDFPNVTLVGVILADQTLNFPDFRSRERTFQLLTQVAGRAGRGLSPGEVIVQSYNPEDPTILAAAQHDYEDFFAKEIGLREMLKYPPFSNLLRVLVTGNQEEDCRINCQGLADKINLLRRQHRVILELLGPSPAPLTKINNQYRWHLVLKGNDIGDLRKVVGSALRSLAIEAKIAKGIRWSLDINPIGMF